MLSDATCVLVVEDEAIIRMNIVSELDDAGYEVFEASTAYDAIDVLNAVSRIRLLFTDIDMPGSMDGLKLATAVRDRWPPVKIMITSGKRLVEITDMPDGSVFFSKPYTHRAVLASMREMLAT